MNTPNNDGLCPCGSGKTHHNCCGAPNVIALNPQKYNDELESIHDELIDFALSNYEETFIRQVEEGLQDSMMDETTADTYFSGITAWGIFQISVAKNKLTIFDIFLKNIKQKSIRKRTRKILEEWRQALPSVYIITSLEENGMELQDIQSKENYWVPIFEDENIPTGGVLIGTLLPFIGYHRFFFSSIEADEDVIPNIEKLLAQYQEGFQTSFPDFLNDLLMLDTKSGIEWEHPAQEEVAELLIQKNLEKETDPELTGLGIMVWHQFCLTYHPKIQKINTYAAALDYFMQMYIADNDEATQKKIAEEYSTTTASISAHYPKFIDLFEEIIMAADLHRSNQKTSTSNPFGNRKDSLETSPKEQAFLLLSQADHATGSKRNKLIKQALAVYPNCLEAYLMLAESAQSLEEKSDLILQAIQAGENELGTEFFQENEGEFGFHPEAKNYLYANEIYMIHLAAMGELEDAIIQGEMLLHLNNMDNQGIRYQLLTLYLEAEQFEYAQLLLEKYAEDETASFLYNKALLSYHMNGLTKETKELLNIAKQQNPYVADFLTDRKEVPMDEPEFIMIGEESEAIAYAQDNYHLWIDEKILQEL